MDEGFEDYMVQRGKGGSRNELLSLEGIEIKNAFL